MNKRNANRARPHRYRLLLYGRFMSRVRTPSLILAVFTLGAWYGIRIQWLTWPPNDQADLLLSSGLFFCGFWVFTSLSPFLAYTHGFENHLRLQTAIYRIDIPYNNIRNTRPVEMQKIFHPSRLSPGQQNFLRPFYGRTALAIELQGLPPPNLLLRVIFHRFTFSPEDLGIVLLVDDWLGLSRQLSSKVDAWRMSRSTHPTRGASSAADILQSAE